ncbi:MAG: tetratricopeptide repeat protein [Solirubrobacterales bacterium]|nr:tetratricopeptide repeat protein [Solirubrobacterales bacterium]
MNARILGVAAAALCMGLGVYLAVAHRDEARLEEGNVEALAARYPQAIRAIDDVRDGVAGARADVLRGYAEAARGRFPASAPFFSRALRRDPNNWVLHRDYAVLLRLLGQREKAQARMRRALALNPRMTLPVGFAAVNDR